MKICISDILFCEVFQGLHNIHYSSSQAPISNGALSIHTLPNMKLISLRLVILFCIWPTNSVKELNISVASPKPSKVSVINTCEIQCLALNGPQ